MTGGRGGSRRVEGPTVAEPRCCAGCPGLRTSRAVRRGTGGSSRSTPPETVQPLLSGPAPEGAAVPLETPLPPVPVPPNAAAAPPGPAPRPSALTWEIKGTTQNVIN